MLARFVPVVLACLAAHGQTFEAVSIKPATPLGPVGMRSDRKGGPESTDPGTYRCQNCPLSWVFAEAYDVEPFEFSAPDWLPSIRYDFWAKLPESGATREQFRTMLQNLLVERFKLAVHREKKEGQLYDLTVGKSGPKFKESVPKERAAGDGPEGKLQKDSDGFPILSPGMTLAVVPGHARLRSDGRTMEWFVRTLSNQLAAPVVDATGLKGKYDFVLSWAFAEGNATTSPEAPDPPGPALVNAVHSQLGLKLERRRGPVEVLVVDHMEKTPTAN